MTSKRQKAANRKNARKSTGPKTQRGKSASRLNAVQHGILSHDVVLPDENEQELEDLRNALYSSLAPVGPLEELLVDRAVNAMWRLQRIERVEAAIYRLGIFQNETDNLARAVRCYEKDGFHLSFNDLDDKIITDKVAHRKAEEDLKVAQARLDQNDVLIGRAVVDDANGGDAFGKLARYETALERSLFRGINEIRRLQEKRSNHTAVVVDV
jgi:hypothetical protein